MKGKYVNALALINELSVRFGELTFDIELRGGNWRCYATDRTTFSKSITIEPLSDTEVTVDCLNFGLSVEKHVLNADNIDEIEGILRGNYLEVVEIVEGEIVDDDEDDNYGYYWKG